MALGNTQEIPKGVNIARGKSIASDYTLKTYDSMLEVSGTTDITLFSANQSFKKAYEITNAGTGNVTITPDGTDTIIGESSVIILPHETVIIVPNTNGDGWLII